MLLRVIHPVFTCLQGEFRLFQSFKLVAEFKERVRVTIPFTGPKMKNSPDNPSPDYFAIASSQARIDYEMPMLLGENGYDTTFAVKLFGKEVWLHRLTCPCVL